MNITKGYNLPHPQPPPIKHKHLRKHNTDLGLQKSCEYHEGLQFTSSSVSPVVKASHQCGTSVKNIQHTQQDTGTATFC